MIRSERNNLTIADSILDDFVRGYFTRGDNALLEAMSELKAESKEARKAKDAEKKAKDAELDRMYSGMTEAEKLALYLN